MPLHVTLSNAALESSRNKKRFPILVKMPSYAYEDQVRIVKSCFMIHNFIRLNQGYVNKYDEWNDDDRNENGDEENDEVDDNGNEQMNATMRDNIANDMWTQYQNYLANRGQGRRL